MSDGLAVFAVILLDNELLDISGVQLVAFVLGLDHELGVGRLVKHGLSGEASRSLTHGGLLIARAHEVYLTYLLEVRDEIDGFGTHHLLVSSAELNPRIS